MDKIQKIKKENQKREAMFDRATVNEETRTVNLAFSSETPVERFFGYEILDHSEGACDLSRMETGIPLLEGHETQKQIGIVEDISIDKDRKGRAVVRFGKSALAEEIFNDVKDGIRRSVSVGYRVHDLALESSIDNVETYRVLRWEILEISLVAVPADKNTGVNRAIENKQSHKKNEVIMEDKKETVVEVVKETIDTRKIEEQTRNQERARVNAIFAEAKEHGFIELGERAISEGQSLDQFRSALLSELKNKKSQAVVLTPKEEKKYSLLRAINAAAKNNWNEAGFEAEVSAEIARVHGKEARGFFAPDQGWSQRTVKNVAGSSGAGASTVGEDYRPDLFIDALVSRSILGTVGAQILTGLKGDVVIPRMSASTTAAFVAEAGSVGNNEPTYNQLTLSSKALANKVALSRSMLINSNPSVEETVKRNMVAVMAAAVDNAALDGSGSGANPTGILNTSGIGDVESAGTSGNAALTYGNCVDIIKEVSIDNALMGNLFWVTHPAVVAKLMQTAKVSSTDSVMIMNKNDELIGYPLVQTTQMPSSSPYALLFGNFADLIVGFFSGLDIVVDPYVNAGTMITNLYFFQDLDIGVMHASSFSAAQDVTV